MPVSILDWLLYFAVFLLPTAVLAYLCGCFNGAVVVSKYILRDDVRNHGSGNAGLTNFYRTFGGVLTLVVILCDVLKMIVAVRLAALPLGDTVVARYWAGLFCLLGHMFPCMFRFKGGKGILSGGTLAIMIDWRIAVVVWGGFLILTALTRYVSLGSLWAGASFPFISWHCYPQFPLAVILAFITGGLVVWQHRANVQRLLHGNENKFSFRRKSAAQSPTNLDAQGVTPSASAQGVTPSASAQGVTDAEHIDGQAVTDPPSASAQGANADAQGVTDPGATPDADGESVTPSAQGGSVDGQAVTDAETVDAQGVTDLGATPDADGESVTPDQESNGGGAA